MYQSFLEDINNILNTGEITNLYAKEDIENMTANLSPILAKLKIPENRDSVYTQYIEQLRDNFHIILCMSPVGDQLRNRTRMFPSLINCCTLDWFFSWPTEALQSVAEQYLSRTLDHLDEKQKTALSMLFPRIHKSVEAMADRFYAELRR
jgi:dynein heavy chain, axonemal